MCAIDSYNMAYSQLCEINFLKQLLGVRHFCSVYLSAFQIRKKWVPRQTCFSVEKYFSYLLSRERNWKHCLCFLCSVVFFFQNCTVREKSRQAEVLPAKPRQNTQSKIDHLSPPLFRSRRHSDQSFILHYSCRCRCCCRCCCCFIVIISLLSTSATRFFSVQTVPS